MQWLGAEGRVSVISGFDLEPVVLKERLTKTYRHPVLDAILRKQRLTQEVRCTARARQLILQEYFCHAEHGISFVIRMHVPSIYTIIGDALCMEYFHEPGYPNKPMQTIKQILTTFEAPDIPGAPEPEPVPMNGEMTRIAQSMGLFIANLHYISHIVHGDLTTANMLIRYELKNESLQVLHLVLIDFGLAQVSKIAEDRAVDLYVLQRALGAIHPSLAGFFDQVLEGYKTFAQEQAHHQALKETIGQFEEVRMRGRKRSMVG